MSKKKKKGHPTTSPFTETTVDEAKEKKPEWTQWERKLESISKREFTKISAEWAAHIPVIVQPGCPPEELVHSISHISAEFHRVGRAGSVLADFPGGRSAILHEAIYLLHKAIHVQIDVARAVAEGRHTWAYVNAYQGSLFALGAALGFLGITSAKSPDGGVIVLDVWPDSAISKGSITGGYLNQYLMIRFRELDHYQKWALLKRALRQTKFKKNYVSKISEALDQLDDKKHAAYRNDVNYTSNIWLSEDLIVDIPVGPITPATSLQDHYDNIYNGTANGTIYTMVSLIEIGCQLLRELSTPKISIIEDELEIAARRLHSKTILCTVDWSELE